MKIKILKILVLIAILVSSGTFIATPSSAQQATCDNDPQCNFTAVCGLGDVVINGYDIEVDWAVEMTPRTTDYDYVNGVVTVREVNNNWNTEMDNSTGDGSVSGSASTTLPGSGSYRVTLNGSIEAWGAYTDSCSEISVVFSIPDASLCNDPLATNYNGPLPCDYTDCSIVDFSADDTTPPYNTSTMLNYAFNGSYPWVITASPAGGPTPSSATGSGGQSSTGNLTALKTYTLTCTSPDGDTDTAVVSVTPDPAPVAETPEVIISASPTSMTLPTNSTTLTWQVFDATSCTASGSWSGAKSISGGSQVMSGLVAGTYTYTLTCTSSEGSAVDSVVVTVDASASSCSNNANLTVSTPLPVGNLTAGQSYNFTVNSANTGSARWYNAANYQLREKSGPVLTPTYGAISSPVLPASSQNWSFAFTAPSTPGSYTIDLQMRNYAGVPWLNSAGVQCAPDPGVDAYFGNSLPIAFTVVAAPPPTPPFGYHDAANCSIIGGWAVDNDTPSSQINVKIYDGPAATGVLLATEPTDVYRGDVNTALGITGNHGFDMLTPLSVKNGLPHSIYTYGVNADGTNTLLTNSPITLNCATPVMSGSITAEASSCNILEGASSCNINFSWNTTNPVGTSAVTKPTNVTVATGNSGTSQPFAIGYSPLSTGLTFSLYNNSVELDTQKVSSDCGPGLDWDGNSCEDEDVGGGGGNCGNGTVDVGEACDEGAGSNGVCPMLCNASCTLWNDCSGLPPSGNPICGSYGDPDPCKTGYTLVNPPGITQVPGYYSWECRSNSTGVETTCLEPNAPGKKPIFIED